MIKWAQFPFLRITLVFMAGILAGFQFEEKGLVAGSLFLAGICVFGMFLQVAKARKSSFAFSLAGLVGLGCFALAGFALTQIRSLKNDSQNLVHFPGEVTHYTGTINDFLLDKPTVFQTTLKLKQIKYNGKWRSATGNIQVSFRKTAGPQKPHYGDVLLIKGSPKLVPAPLNPGQFDYRKYLANQQIYHQHFINPGQVELIGQEIKNPVMALSIKLRENLDLIFKKRVPSQREYGIASALVLGVKDQLDNDIKATYTNTGTMHVLAVSGLHVGLVFFLLNLGLKRLRTSFSHRLLSAVIVLSVVWAFAYITALSPSVLRAAVMFTLVVGAQLLLKKSDVYNTLAVAAFILLCFNPFYLLDVGFQLSFLAVIAIVYLQPKIYRLYQAETWLGDKIWTLICISLAAQIGTFPLSLFYFHQFPVYFLLSNLIAVPLSTVILYSGFTVLLFNWIPVLGEWAGKVMQGLLWVMNEAMIVLEKLPYALINRIPVTGFQTLLIAIFLLLILIFLARPKLRTAILAGFVLLLFSGSQVKETFANSAQKRFIIFAVPRQSVIGFIDNQQAFIMADSGFISNNAARNFTLEPTFLNARISEVKLQNWQTKNAMPIPVKTAEGSNLIRWRNLSILTLHKPLKRNLKTPLKIDVLVLQKNVWISPEKISANFTPGIIVFDSSNESWYVRWLGKKLKAANMPFHDVNTQGAFESRR